MLTIRVQSAAECQAECIGDDAIGSRYLDYRGGGLFVRLNRYPVGARPRLVKKPMTITIRLLAILGFGAFDVNFNYGPAGGVAGAWLTRWGATRHGKKAIDELIRDRPAGLGLPPSARCDATD
jgi:hypothetical protein